MIGGDRCPIVDTYWQTETGSIVMTPLLGALPQKPGSCSLPFFGISAKVLREDGTEAGTNEGGLLVIDKPFPSMLRTVWGDDKRYEQQYFSRFPGGVYFTGDGARRDADGFFWVVGRKREMIKSGAHRISPREIEDVLLLDPAVEEAAVIGRPDEVLGEVVIAHVTARPGQRPSADALRLLCQERLAPSKVPVEIHVRDTMPRNASGKVDKLALAAGVLPR